LATGATQLVTRLQLDSAGVAANARALVELQLGGDAGCFLSTWFAKQCSVRESGEAGQLQAIDRIFSSTDWGGSEGRKAFLLGQPVAAIVQPLDEKLRSEIRRWVSSRADDSRERLAGARRAITWLSEHFSEAEAELQRLRRKIASKLSEVRQAALAACRPDGMAIGLKAGEAYSQHVLDYFRLQLDQLAIMGAEHTVHLILSDAKAMSDEIIALGREIDQIIQAVCRTRDSEQPHATTEAAKRSSARVLARLQHKLPELAAAVDAQLQADFISQHGGLWKTVMQGGRPRAQLGAKLQELSRQAVQHLLAGVNVLDGGTTSEPTERDANLRSGLAIATPALLEFGGTRRVLAVMPRDSGGGTEVAAFSRAIGTNLTAIGGADNSLTLCVEADQLSLRHIALELVQCRRDRVEFAGRVHCRTDVAWAPLVSLSTTPPPAVWAPDAGNNSRQTQTRQDMCKTLVM
jgi:hypothetical protein